MTAGELQNVVAGQSVRYPVASALCQEVLRGSVALLQGQLGYVVEKHGIAFWERAEEIGILAREVCKKPVEALLEYTVEYLREQVAFMKTGEYRHDSFDDARREVYDNADIMEGFYLEGLLMTHAFWPIHFEIHNFFMESFVTRVPDEGKGTEIGFGHGLYLWEILRHTTQTFAQAYDISSYSQAFAGKLLHAGGIDASRYSLDFGDITGKLPCGSDELQWAVFAEVLEHIPDPHGALTELGRCLAAGAPAFIGTVVDSNAVDHMYQFESVAHIRDVVSDSGFHILDERVLAVKDYSDGKSRDPSLDVVLVCENTNGSR